MSGCGARVRPLSMSARNSICLPGGCAVTLHRTLRIPDDGGEYPLPPSLGAMEIHSIADDESVVPMRRAEALWLSFEAPWWKPHALKVGVGGVDAISGEAFDATTLSTDPQDYIVIAEQPWLDGINSGDGSVRQFVAVPLGERLTIEGQLTGSEDVGGLTLALFAPRPGRFPDEAPISASHEEFEVMACAAPMGVAAGGRLRQEIYADEHGIETWQHEPVATVHVDLVDAMAFETLTGLTAPPAIVDAATYTRFGLPWFDLVDTGGADIRAAQRLAGVRSLADLEGRDEQPLPIPEAQVVRLLRLRASVA